MEFLADPQQQAERDKYSLLGLGQENTDDIYDIIEQSVQGLLASK
jgi:hypothetical protein